MIKNVHSEYTSSTPVDSTVRFRSHKDGVPGLKNNVTKLLFLYNILLHDINNIIVLLLFLYCVQSSYNAYVLLAVCLLVDCFLQTILVQDTFFGSFKKYIYCSSLLFLK